MVHGAARHRAVLRRADFENPAYIEFRFGDFQCELGIIDAKYAPHQVGNGPAGAVIHWHVDDLEGDLERLLSLGATLLEPITERGNNTGFRTASVVDPFGNIIGIMNNPHYLEILADLGQIRPEPRSTSGRGGWALDAENDRCLAPRKPRSAARMGLRAQ